MVSYLYCFFLFFFYKVKQKCLCLIYFQVTEIQKLVSVSGIQLCIWSHSHYRIHNIEFQREIIIIIFFFLVFKEMGLFLNNQNLVPTILYKLPRVTFIYKTTASNNKGRDRQRGEGGRDQKREGEREKDKERIFYLSSLWMSFFSLF